MTSNNTRGMEFKTKFNDLEKIISTKGITEDLINKFKFLNGAKQFSIDGLQNHLVFKSFRKNSVPIKYANNIQLITGTDNIYSWRSTVLSEEEIVNPYEPDTKFSPKLAGTIILKGICLKQKSVSFLYKDIVNLYISYKSDTQSKDLNTNFTLGNCLFGAVKLANLQHRV